MFPALPLSRFRLPALTLIVSALTLAACNAPPSSTLPLAPEAASGYRAGLQASHADKHMAAAANPLAAEAGREMLRKGGSAIDAAIAMQAVLTGRTAILRDRRRRNDRAVGWQASAYL